MRFKVTPVYEKNNNANTPIIVNRGGAGSSKSHSIAQLIILRALQYPGRRILCLRKTRASIHDSLWYMIRKVLYDTIEGLGGQGRLLKVRENKTTHSLTFFNKSYIHMDGLDDPEKRKSSEWHDIWFEEATEFLWGDYSTMSLYNRATPQNDIINQILISFNPTDANHWLKTKLIDATPDLTEIHSSFLDNAFLSKPYTDKLNNLIMQDKNLYRIYTKGEWGRLENIIYKNWDTIDEMLDNLDDRIYGLDFGFNNPSSLSEVGIKDMEFYVDEKLYKTGLTNPALIAEMDELEIDRNAKIYADSAEPARIQEIRNAGYNVHPAYKSVFDGIDSVNSHKLHITKRSTNILKEIRAYSWKKDRQENILDEPVKYLDHAMDDIRYAIATYLKSQNTSISAAPKFGTKKSLFHGRN